MINKYQKTGVRPIVTPFRSLVPLLFLTFLTAFHLLLHHTLLHAVLHPIADVLHPLSQLHFEPSSQAMFDKCHYTCCVLLYLH